MALGVHEVIFNMTSEHQPCSVLSGLATNSNPFSIFLSFFYPYMQIGGSNVYDLILQM